MFLQRGQKNYTFLSFIKDVVLETKVTFTFFYAGKLPVHTFVK